MPPTCVAANVIRVSEFVPPLWLGPQGSWLVAGWLLGWVVESTNPIWTNISQVIIGFDHLPPNFGMEIPKKKYVYIYIRIYILYTYIYILYTYIYICGTGCRGLFHSPGYIRLLGISPTPKFFFRRTPRQRWSYSKQLMRPRKNCKNDLDQSSLTGIGVVFQLAHSAIRSASLIPNSRLFLVVHILPFAGEASRERHGKPPNWQKQI